MTPSLINLLSCLAPLLSTTTFRQLHIVALAMFAMTGRVTMLGISRWADQGGSYRTVQRFFATKIDWLKVQWALIHAHTGAKTGVWLVAGDETVTTKSGHATFGLARFFSSLFGKPVPGLSFFALSLIHVETQTSYPLCIKQQVRPEKEVAETSPQPAAAKSTPAKRGRGRPKGSKNKSKEAVALSPYLLFILGIINAALPQLQGVIPVAYLVLDGAFGHHDALRMAKMCGLDLICKMRQDSVLYLPYEGVYRGRGPRRKYGQKVDFHNIPQQYLKNTTVDEDDDVQTRIYQMTVLHKLFPQNLNVVVIYKTNLKTKTSAYVILFSGNLTLPYDLMVKYYSLRFQIEFDFRDAKQYWGLEDFMNVKETTVTNAANLAFFMVNLSRLWIQKNQPQNPNFSLEDLKAYFRGHKYAREILKLLPEKPDPILINQIEAKIATLGGINV